MLVASSRLGFQGRKKCLCRACLGLLPSVACGLSHRALQWWLTREKEGALLGKSAWLSLALMLGGLGLGMYAGRTNAPLAAAGYVISGVGLLYLFRVGIALRNGPAKRNGCIMAGGILLALGSLIGGIAYLSIHDCSWVWLVGLVLASVGGLLLMSGYLYGG
jgi:hypothetical protein